MIYNICRIVTQDGYKMSEIIEQNGYFQSFDKLEMYYHSWTPTELVADETKAVFIGVHGGGTHAQNMSTVAEYFSSKGHPFYVFDRRGHGHCEKKQRMYVKDYNYAIEDIRAFINFVKEKEAATKIYLIAHSNGGGHAIVAATRFPELIDKLILSSPSIKLVGNNFALSIQKSTAYLLGTILPRFPIPSTIKLEELVKDSDILESRLQDELICGTFRVRWIRELFRFQKAADKNIHRLEVPTLFLIGTDDRIVDSYYTMEKFETIKQKDKMKLNVYEGYWHEIFNELPENRVKAFHDIEEFIKL